MTDLIYNLHATNITVNYHSCIDAHSPSADQCSVVPDNPKKIDKRGSGLKQYASDCDHDCVCDPALELDNQKGAPHTVFGKNWAPSRNIEKMP
jgi:hypothetical protein